MMILSSKLENEEIMCRAIKITNEKKYHWISFSNTFVR